MVLVLGAAAGAAFTGWRYARESPPHQGPILLITADGLPAARLRAYGATGSSTPAIDALATDAVVFDRAYAHSPQTLPAHAALLSGQLPFETGVRDDAGFVLQDDARTLAELLRNRGFATGAAVSTFLLRSAAGVGQGFSYYDAAFTPPPDGGPAVERDAADTIESATRWIDAQDGQRFLLFVQVKDTGLDAAVGRIVQQLQDRGLYDDATILLVGDHGDSSGDTLADEALHVPLIIKQPGAEGAGRRVAAPVQHIDLLPTILDLVRAPVPSTLRGRSLRPVLDGDDGTVPDRPIYAESLAARFTLGADGIFGVTSGPLRLVRADTEAVYDLTDGGRALEPDSPDAVRLRATLDALLEGRAVIGPAAASAEDETSLAALGHLPGPRLAVSTPVRIDRAERATLQRAFGEAARLLAARRDVDAADRLRAIARTHPQLAAAHYELGSLLARMGRLADAADALERAAALEPDHPAVPAALAAVYLRAHVYDRAKQRAEHAVALAELRDAPSLAAAHEIAARVALAQADADAAVRHADAAQQADEARPLAKFVQGRMLFEEGRFEDALAAFEEAEAGEQRSRPIEDLHLYLGDTLARLERHVDAEAHYRRELESFPGSTRAYAGLALLYRALDRTDDAAAVIGDLMDAAPTPEGYAEAARLWTTFGEPSRADSVRADARRRFPETPARAHESRQP